MARVLLGTWTLLSSPSVLLGAEEHAVDQEPAWWLLLLFAMFGAVIWVFARGRYLVWKDGELRPAFTELQEFSSYLLAGTVVAQVWVHGDPGSYAATMHAELFHVSSIDLNVNFHFLVNDVFMALFFGIAAKELVEATMKPDGVLRGGNSILPMMACIGGVVAPAIVYRLLCTSEMSSAWAVPCATDIAFAWLGARVIWGRSHPAVAFLLAVAVADDFVGMGIIAVCYPQRPLSWSGLSLLALGVILALVMNRLARYVPPFRRWPLYLIPGLCCWIGLLASGLHAALALVFVVPFIPMAGRDEGIFTEDYSRFVSALRRSRLVRIFASPRAVGEQRSMDPLNRFEHTLKPFVDTGLFFFGLANAGVFWLGAAAWDQNSWAVFLGLGIGKTLGIGSLTIAGYLLLRAMGQNATLPVEPKTRQQLQWSDLPLIGLLGAMGFTVALFVADAAGAPDSLKLGAIASFFYLALAVALGRWFVRPASSIGEDDSRDDATPQSKTKVTSNSNSS